MPTEDIPEEWFADNEERGKRKRQGPEGEATQRQRGPVAQPEPNRQPRGSASWQAEPVAKGGKSKGKLAYEAMASYLQEGQDGPGEDEWGPEFWARTARHRARRTAVEAAEPGSEQGGTGACAEDADEEEQGSPPRTSPADSSSSGEGVYDPQDEA